MSVVLLDKIKHDQVNLPCTIEAGAQICTFFMVKDVFVHLGWLYKLMPVFLSDNLMCKVLPKWYLHVC